MDCGGNVFVILWEFRARPRTRAAFLRAYGSRGEWARLFRKAPGYLATQLLPDPEDRLRFFTVDIWKSAAAFRSAKRQWEAEYHALDALCGNFTTRERHIGSFTLRGNPSRTNP